MSIIPRSRGSPSSKICEVCGLEGHGLHFGAITCRACAAFFRRVGAGARFTIECQVGDDRCEITSNGRSCCKKCRLKKCKDIGMIVKNFQYNRDPYNAEKIAPSMTSFLGRPQCILSCDPETAASTSTANFIDLSEIIDKVNKILSQDTQIPHSPRQNRLQKLVATFNSGRFSHCMEEDLKELTTIGFKESMSFWESNILMTANWLTHFDEFQELNQNIKLEFLKIIWSIWGRLEKLAQNALFHRSYNNNDTSKLLVGDDGIVDRRNVKLDIGWLTDYSVEQFAYYIESRRDGVLNKPLQAMIDLNPTDIELNYMLAQLSFSYASKHFPGEGNKLEIAEHLQQLIADDLHAYYTEELNMTSYSDRILKMMKVNNMLQRLMWERREKLKIARMFDIFKVEFSDPELFRDTL